MKILEVRPEQVIILDNGQITTRPNSPYYSLRYFTYNSKRINYIFSDTSYVMETYDDRIFNCWHEGMRIQLRQDLSEKLAISINHHMEFGNEQEYEELFKFAYEEQPNWQILKLYLKNSANLQLTTKGYIVHESFKIDFKGNAWVRHKDTPGFNDGWHSLCIVMSGKDNYSKPAKESELPDEYGHMIHVNSLSMTIFAKIIFLLNPDLDDKVFTGQLSKSLLQRLSNRKGGE